MTDLYETPDMPGEVTIIDDPPQESIEEITARLIRDRDKRIAELEREVEAAKHDICNYVSPHGDFRLCDMCGRLDCELREFRSSEYCEKFALRGPVEGENVEVRMNDF